MDTKATSDEIDFNALDRNTKSVTKTSPTTSTSSKSQLGRLFDRQRSFREVQNAITKINPELLKASLAGVCPVLDSNGPRRPAIPLTIFYNGTVSIFEIPQDKADVILKFVEEGWFKKPPAAEEHKIFTNSISDWMANTNRRRLLQRNVSLQRFLEKRKERYRGSLIDY